MQITIVTGAFLPTGGGPSGAVEKRWLGVAKILAGKGHQVTIVARRWPGQAADEVVDGIHFVRHGGYTRTSSITFDIVKDFLYSVRVLLNAPEADITVSNTFWLPILAVLRKRTLGYIVVNVARFPKKQMWLYRFADRLSAVSNVVAKEIARQSPEVEHLVKVIPNPVDISCFRSEGTVPPSLNSFRVLYTGRVHPEKGLHLLIPALAQLIPDFPRIELAIVGPTKVEHGGGGDAYVAHLTRLSRGLKVNFEPSITEPSRLAARMREADYYCYPSLADEGESFGIAPLEAMALGYAPILSKLACFQEFSEDGSNCFVFDHLGHDPVANLTAALRRAMAAPQSTREMGANAVRTSKKFNYNFVAQSYLDDWSYLLNK